MKEITLEKLNSTSFEGIVKALAMEKLGPAGHVFPPGPDGARDFSYEGLIEGYQAQKWDGYLVVQAKFKEKLRGGSDVTWLIDQLSGELAKFTRPNSTYRKPQYYIIATNINLSGADTKTKTSTRKSGLTKVSDHMKTWVNQIGLKGFDIWPSEKIETFLTASEAIRTAYLPSLLAGDVLNKLYSKLNKDQKNLEYALKVSLIHLLKRDKNVRLKDAGSLTDDAIRASQVFVDLPTRPLTGVSIMHSGPFVKRTIYDSKGIFRAQNIGTDSSQKRDRRNKIVLLGGPGQGKSTASLFLTQLFRAALLRETPNQTFDDQTNELITEIFERAINESIDDVLPSRYPAWVSLPQFADKISAAKAGKVKKPSILSFIANEISDTSHIEITVSDLRDCLKNFPWFFTFDGLDEVPPSGERESVLAAIQDLITEVELLNCDAFFVVTSRPQGYNSDFDPEQWTHKELKDLPLTTALSYAKLLAKSYYRDDPYRQQKIVDQLERSADRASTRRLMKSPLQVTILHMIVDTGGGVPSSRWSLFHEYFEILKKREKSKGGEVQRTLDKNLTQIGPIHQRAGLRLHVDAEVAGSATASLDMYKLSILIRSFLVKEGFEEVEIQERLAELTELALNRLVLLSSREEGKISFDVRSLQEFMAASALTAESPQVIEERLLLLAGKSHWQHVFTIAASRCFSEDNLHYLRSAITQIPKRLEDSRPHQLVGNGALLSLALFSDDIAADHPTFRRLLALHALETLLHDFDHNADLNILIEPHTEQCIFDALRDKYITHTDDAVKAAAWELIISQSTKGHPVAKQYLSQYWPSCTVTCFEIIKHGTFPALDIEFHPLVLKTLVQTSFCKILSNAPTLISRLLSDFFQPELDPESLEIISTSNPGIIDTLKIFSPGKIEVPALGLPGSVSSVTAKLIKIDGLSGIPKPPPSIKPHPEWEFLFTSIDFSDAPTRANLEACVSVYDQLSISDDDKSTLLDHVPWVIPTAISSCSDHSINLSKIPDSFDLGTFEDWNRAEQRFLSKGFTLEDYFFQSKQTNITSDISETGIGHFTGYSLNTQEDPSPVITYYVEKWHQTTDEKAKELLEKFIQYELITHKSFIDLDQKLTSNLIHILNNYISNPQHDSRFIYHESVTKIKDFALKESDIFKLVNIANKVKVTFQEQFVEPSQESNFHLLCSHIDLDTNKKSLLNIVCILRTIYKNSTTTLRRHLLSELANDIDKNISFSANTILFLDNHKNANDYAQDIIPLLKLDTESNHFNILLNVIENHNLKLQSKIDLTSALVEYYRIHNHANSVKLKTKLKSFLDSEFSGLAEQETWLKLSLPGDAHLPNSL
ncbi:hypothetical protein [Pseudomonas caspiana]|uniref:NACHT domain-containing protein n=1 Tax=Pseudomonas caspiana TaxID=1451454 RepID=UPI0032EE9A1E